MTPNFPQPKLAGCVCGVFFQLRQLLPSRASREAWTREKSTLFTRVSNLEFMTHGRMQVDRSLGTLEMCTEKFQIQLKRSEALRGFRQVTTGKLMRCQLQRRKSIGISSPFPEERKLCSLVSFKLCCFCGRC